MPVTEHTTAEITRACSAFEDEKFDYKKECDKIQALAAECGLPKDKADDVRLCVAYLKGIVAGRKK